MKALKCFFFLITIAIFNAGCDKTPVQPDSQFIALFARPTLRDHLPLAVYVDDKYAGVLTTVAQFDGDYPDPQTNKDVLVIPVESGKHTVSFYAVPEDKSIDDNIQDSFIFYTSVTLFVESNSYSIQGVSE